MRDWKDWKEWCHELKRCSEVHNFPISEHLDEYKEYFDDNISPEETILEEISYL